MAYIDEYKEILNEMHIEPQEATAQSGDESALIFKTRTDKINSLTVMTKFISDAPIITVDLFDFVKIPDEDYGKVVMVINDLNIRFRFGKLYIDEQGDVCVSESCLVDENSAMEEIWSITKMLLNVLDDAYPQIMKALYA